MASSTSREAYFETGLAVLAKSGYGALKLSEVCRHLGVTTGSFYHFFKNWGAYTEQLLDYWLQTTNVRALDAAHAEKDPHKRVDLLIEYGLQLPHGADAAIRTWSAIDPAVRTLQEDVDQKRFDVVYGAMLEILDDEVKARYFANWAIYLIVGYEQTSLPHDVVALEWVARQLLDALAASQAEADSRE